MRAAIICVLFLAACAPRAELVRGGLPGAPVEEIFVGATRVPEGDGFGSRRSDTLTLAKYDVAIPPDRLTGSLSVPRADRARPQTDFMVADSWTYPTARAFRAALSREIVSGNGEAVVFIHGYNNNFAEGLYRFAQIGADFDLPGVKVQYAWPSSGRTVGYAYDRDSALFARDGLVALLNQIRLAGAKRILIVAHSMGGVVTVEALRQMAQTNDRATLARIGGVVLISPDIDVDVFRSSARQIGKLPQPFLIFASPYDRALGLSSQISGETNRLGNLSDISRISDLNVTLIDTAAFDIQGGHFNVANSPGLIQILRNWTGVSRSLANDQARDADPVARAALTARNATRIVLDSETYRNLRK